MHRQPKSAQRPANLHSSCPLEARPLEPCGAGQRLTLLPCHRCSAGTCNGNVAQRCAEGTWCKDGSASLSPCRAKKPSGSCPNGDRACVNTSTYCESGKLFTCPAGWHCVGYGPCVKKA